MTMTPFAVRQVPDIVPSVLGEPARCVECEMSVIDFQHARDLVIARADFIRHGGTASQWREIVASLEEAARRFSETSRRRTCNESRPYPVGLARS
jgi:hypothetical protein